MARNDRLGLVLRSLLVIVERFETGQEPPGIDELAQRFQESIRRIDDEMSFLVERGVLRAASGSSGEPGLVPARAPDQITVVDVLGLMLHVPDDDRPASPLDREAANVLRSYRDGGARAVGGLSLRELVARLARDSNEANEVKDDDGAGAAETAVSE
jgi:DNA-binding IscR family transcriptional regulator